MSVLVLSCNRGAKVGNYFMGQAWKNFDSVLTRGKDRSSVTFAAVDCITLLTDDGLGGLVFEYEMHRVRGYDVHPRQVFKRKDREDRFHKLTQAIRMGLRRITPWTYIVVVLNPIAYRAAFLKAVEQECMWDRVCYVEWLVCGFAIPAQVVCTAHRLLKSPVVGIQRVEAEYCYKFCSVQAYKTALRIYERSVENLPDEYRFRGWNN